MLLNIANLSNILIISKILMNDVVHEIIYRLEGVLVRNVW